MDILNPRFFVRDKALRSLVALATKASKQRSIGKKDGFKMFRNLGYKVLKKHKETRGIERMWCGFIFD